MITDARSYVIDMLRRDLRREPTLREIAVWQKFFELNGAFAPERVTRDAEANFQAMPGGAEPMKD